MPVLASLRAGIRLQARCNSGSLAVAGSLKLPFVGANDPLGERLAIGPTGQVVAGDALHIGRKLLGRRLQTAKLAPEPSLLTGPHAQRAAEVDLEALDQVAIRARHELALQTDVGHLGARAGVGAAVDVDGDFGVQVADALLEM